MYIAQGVSPERDERSTIYKVGISKNSTKTIYLASYGSPVPQQIGSCGENTIGVLDFSPTFIIKACHQ